VTARYDVENRRWVISGDSGAIVSGPDREEAEQRLLRIEKDIREGMQAHYDEALRRAEEEAANGRNKRF